MKCEKPLSATSVTLPSRIAQHYRSSKNYTVAIGGAANSSNKNS